MTDITEIVDVQITRETAVVERANFGIPLIIVEVSEIDERIRTYTSPAGVADDYLNTDEAYKMATAAFSAEVKPRYIKIAEKLDSETYVEGLQAAQALDDAWYGIAAETIDASDIQAIAAWVETQKKLYIARSADADIITTATDDVASLLDAGGYDRTAIIYDVNAATKYADIAWLADVLPRDPGSQTWAFKDLKTITANTLTTSESTRAHGKNANTYERVAGNDIIRNGTAASGEYLDIMRGVDWLESRITEEVFRALINTDKLPYDNDGIAVIENIIRQQIDIAIQRRFLSENPPPVITIPDVLDTEEADRVERILRDVSFSARLAGAIHKLIIRGTVSA